MSCQVDALIAFSAPRLRIEGMRVDALKIPSPTVTEEAREALCTLARVLQEEDGVCVCVQPVGESDDVMARIPREAYELLLEVLGQMANGNAVTVTAVPVELTTHLAAKLLNVSRPYLIDLLEARKIPYQMVGTHRRIRLTDLMTYKQQDDERRHEALDELTRQAQELGLGY